MSIALVFVLALHAPAAGLPQPAYTVGETARVDIVSPLHLIVIDHDRTAKLRQQEAQRVPAIFRFYPSTAEEAEANLRAAFAAGREEFLDALEKNYDRRTLNEAAIAYPRFQRLVASLQKESPSFPLNTNLARVWALGASGEVIQSNLVARLREMMSHPIRTDALPAEGKKGSKQVKMLTLPPEEVVVDLALVDKQATNCFRTNIYVLGRARRELQAGFPGEERAMGRFVAGFLKPNCAFDPDLTRQSRAKNTEALWAADEYEPGQLIVKQGALIDARIKAVLDQLGDRAAGEQAKKDLANGQLEAQAAVAAARLHEQEARAQANAQAAAQIAAEQNRWLWWGVLCASPASLFVLWPLLARRRRSRSLLPAKVHRHDTNGAFISCPSCTNTIVLPLELIGPASGSIPAASSAALPQPGGEVPALVNGQYWKDRALAAESRLQKTNHALRSALLPHLGRWLMSKLTRRLSSQRNHLLDTQRKAQQELAELERRLLDVQAPLEDRLKAYEERIAELEKDLTAKGKENRELIEATIAMARKKLEAERSKDPLPWN